ncbi:hypothetical protein DP939_25105 [Spongiactinospora rosea]|uniref:SAF domain-containing protein n=1 Tax=Spongiactinospora rosea TaxID=2248750 RepID=A0A366LTI1_9ACTN|nr:SAF domain-containing protein [Spongiactinospora rosea]RBQ17228.1 hypothetical protein DP939_25105 [Spongiactinospora rosea]
MLALGVALVVVMAYGGYLLHQAFNTRVPVLATARDVAVGQVIEAADLATVQVAVDAAQVATIPASQAGQVVGMRAAVAVRAGMLLAPSAVTNAVSPAAGLQLVAVALKPSQIPARGLAPGDQVLIVSTPDGSAAAPPPSSGDAEQGEEGAAGDGAEWQVPAAVDQVKGPDADGLVTVDVLIVAASGPRVARQASTGRIAVVLTSPQQR